MDKNKSSRDIRNRKDIIRSVLDIKEKSTKEKIKLINEIIKRKEK